MPVSVNTPSRVKFQPARELNFLTISDTFQTIGDPFTSSFVVLFVQNFTDVTIDFSISYGGEDVSFTLASGGALTSDMLANSGVVAAGESAWCKYRFGAPSSGFVQVSSIELVN